MSTMIVTVSLKDGDSCEQTFQGRVIVPVNWRGEFYEAAYLSNAIADAFEKFVKGSGVAPPKAATAYKEYDAEYRFGDEDAFIAAQEEEGPCLVLEKELDDFYEDPMTEAYGAQDCSTALIQAHRTRCPKCQKEARR